MGTKPIKRFRLAVVVPIVVLITVAAWVGLTIVANVGVDFSPPDRISR